MATRRPRADAALLVALIIAGCTSTSESPAISTPAPDDSDFVVIEVGDNESAPDAVEAAAGETADPATSHVLTASSQR